MKKMLRLLPFLLALALLGGCALPELKNVDPNHIPDPRALVRRWLGQEEPAPSPTPEPTPSPTPRPEGAQGRILDLLEALVRDDRETVRSVCDTLPGYTAEEESESPVVRELYAAAYRKLEWKLLNSKESAASATVMADISVPDLRAALERLKKQWETDPPSGDRAAAADEALAAVLAGDLETQNRRITFGLVKKDGEWVLRGSAETYNALSGSLYRVLTDLDLPAETPEDTVFAAESRPLKQYLCDAPTFCLRATELRPNDPAGWTLECELTNKSASTMILSLRNVAINGYVMDADEHWELRGGGKCTIYLRWSRSELARCGITEVKNLRFRADSFARAAWPVYPSDSRACEFYPSGWSDERTPLPEWEGQQTVLDEPVAGFTVLGVDYEGCWGCTVTVAAENRCGQELWFSVGDLTVGGCELSPRWSCTLPAGMKSVGSFRITAGELLLNSLPDADDLSFYLSVGSTENIDSKTAGVTTGCRYTLTIPE